MEGVQKEYILPIDDVNIRTAKAVKEIMTGDEFYICFRLDTAYLSDGMWDKVNLAVVEAKRKSVSSANCKRWKSTGSSDITFYYFVLAVWVDIKGIHYYIDGMFFDNENKTMDACISVAIDLHEYDKMVKVLVHKYVDDTFFTDIA